MKTASELERAIAKQIALARRCYLRTGGAMSDTKSWFEEEIKSATDEIDKLPAWVRIAAEFDETLFESDTRDVLVHGRAPTLADEAAAHRVMELLRTLVKETKPKYRPATCSECGSERPHHWMSCSNYTKHF